MTAEYAVRMLMNRLATIVASIKAMRQQIASREQEAEALRIAIQSIDLPNQPTPRGPV